MKTIDKTGLVFGICGAALFSAKPVLIKLVYGYDIAPVIIMTLRMGMSLPFYLVFAIVALRQRHRKGIETDFSATTLVSTAAIGLVGYYFSSYLDLLGLTHITAQFERLILFTYPIFVALISWLFFRQRLTAATFVALLLTTSGLALIFTHDLESFGTDIMIGVLQVLTAAILFASYVTFSKPIITSLGSRLFTCFAMAAASVAIIIHFFVTNSPSDLAVAPQVYGLAFVIAVFSTVLPSFLIAEAINRLSPTPVSILSSVGPVFTSIMAVLVLGEAFTLIHIIGTLLIIGGISFMALAHDRVRLNQSNP